MMIKSRLVQMNVPAFIYYRIIIFSLSYDHRSLVPWLFFISSNWEFFANSTFSKFLHKKKDILPSFLTLDGIFISVSPQQAAKALSPIISNLHFFAKITRFNPVQLSNALSYPVLLNLPKGIASSPEIIHM